MFDYLKAFADQNEDYKIVYDAYMSNSNNVSVGNVINIFFTRGQHANNSKFKKGTAKIEDIKFANYLLHNISNLYEKYGRRRIQAYCVREFVKVAYAKAQKNKKAVEYLFKQYEKMAKRDHLAISSISEFKPILEVYLNDYKLMSK